MDETAVPLIHQGCTTYHTHTHSHTEIENSYLTPNFPGEREIHHIAEVFNFSDGVQSLAGFSLVPPFIKHNLENKIKSILRQMHTCTGPHTDTHTSAHTCPFNQYSSAFGRVENLYFIWRVEVFVHMLSWFVIRPQPCGSPNQVSLCLSIPPSLSAHV